MYEGKVKSGGYAKYNIAQILNNNLEGTLLLKKGKVVSIPLSQCPDPQARIEVTFSFGYSEEGKDDMQR